MHILLRFLGLVLAFIITTTVVPGITITGGWSSIALVALVWSLMTLIIRPVLGLLTLPLTLLTFGIFSLILNALLFWAITLIIPQFAVDGFFAALVGSIVLSVVSWFIHKMV